MQSVPITTDVVSSNLDQIEVYNKQPQEQAKQPAEQDKQPAAQSKQPAEQALTWLDLTCDTDILQRLTKCMVATVKLSKWWLQLNN